ncbi:MAG: hypothetical protein AB1730_28205 [Myxococcota bacterium]
MDIAFRRPSLSGATLRVPLRAHRRGDDTVCAGVFLGEGEDSVAAGRVFGQLVLR